MIFILLRLRLYQFSILNVVAVVVFKQFIKNIKNNTLTAYWIKKIKNKNFGNSAYS
jgi:hypothetical protein